MNKILKMISKKFNRLINIVNNKKYIFNVNLVSLFLKEGGKIHFNINEIKFEKSDIYNIKEKIVSRFKNKLVLDNTFKIHFFNHLMVNNEYINKKALLIKYLRSRKINIKKISASFLDSKDLELFLNYGIKVEVIEKKKRNVNLISVIIWLLVELITERRKNNLYNDLRSRYDPEKKYIKMIRAWYELSDNIYTQKLNESFEKTIIYISPHITGGKITNRQEKYINQIKNSQKEYFFFVPKINFFYLLKIELKVYFRKIPSQFKLPICQIVKERLEIDSLINFIKIYFPDIRRFYTKEEFYPQSIYLTEKLKELGINVINSAHGIAIYGTCVNYDEFYVITKKQKLHYQKRGNSKLKYFNSKSKDIDIDIENKEPALFFVHQHILSSPSRRSEKIIDLYMKIIKFIEEISKKNEIKVFAKYHPGSTEKDKILTKNIEIIEDVKDLPKNYFYIAVTFHSVYVIELLDKMPFIIINPDEQVDMTNFFPKEPTIFARTYDEFENNVSKLISNNRYYNKYWKELIEQI